MGGRTRIHGQEEDGRQELDRTATRMMRKMDEEDEEEQGTMDEVGGQRKVTRPQSCSPCVGDSSVADSPSRG